MVSISRLLPSTIWDLLRRQCRINRSHRHNHCPLSLIHPPRQLQKLYLFPPTQTLKRSPASVASSMTTGIRFNATNAANDPIATASTSGTAQQMLRLQMQNIVHSIESNSMICACGERARNCAVQYMKTFVRDGKFPPDNLLRAHQLPVASSSMQPLPSDTMTPTPTSEAGPSSSSSTAPPFINKHP